MESRRYDPAMTGPVRVNDAAVVLAIDIGGTKLAAGLVSLGGEMLWSKSTPTPQGPGEQVYSTLVGLVNEALDAAGHLGPVEVCGVGCGGPMARSGVHVSPLNIPGLREFPLPARLSRDTGLDVYVDNDAKALALGEWWMGSARGCDAFMAMVVSTGVGGGIVLDGRLLDGRLGNAGHVGHVIVEPDGAECACGGRGCLEAEISGPSISRRLGGAPPAAAPEIERRRAGTLLGRAVASVVNLLDLDLVLVGGSVALGYGEPFFVAAQDELDQRSTLDFSAGAVVAPVGLGAEAPLIGAAAVGLRSSGAIAEISPSPPTIMGAHG